MDTEFRRLQRLALREPAAMHGLFVAALRAGLLTQDDLTAVWAMGNRPGRLDYERGDNAWISDVAGAVLGIKPTAAEPVQTSRELAYERIMRWPMEYLIHPLPMTSVYDQHVLDASVLLCRAVEHALGLHVNTPQTGYEPVTMEVDQIDELQSVTSKWLDKIEAAPVSSLHLLCSDSEWRRLRNRGGQVNMLDVPEDVEPGSMDLLPVVSQGVVSFLDMVLAVLRGAIPRTDFDTFSHTLPTFVLARRDLGGNDLPRTRALEYYVRDVLWGPMIPGFLKAKGVL